MMLPFELRQIRVFLILADELHFARTAQQTGLTPSRVSQTIRRLEAALGAPLFERTSRRVTITPLGEQLQREMAPAYQQLQRAFLAGQAISSTPTGTLGLAMYTPINGGPHLLEIIRAFETQHPACRVRTIDTGLDKDARNWLRSGEADVLATRLPLSDPDMVIGPVLSREPRLLAVAVDHELATRESVTVTDLADYRLPDHPSIPRELMDAFSPSRLSAPARPDVVSVKSFTEAIMRVATGEIVHPTVRSFLDYYAHPGVVSVPISDLPPSQTALVWLAETETAKIRAFAQTADAVIQDHA